LSSEITSANQVHRCLLKAFNDALNQLTGGCATGRKRIAKAFFGSPHEGGIKVEELLGQVWMNNNLANMWGKEHRDREEM
jgi:hypothetical protein